MRLLRAQREQCPQGRLPARIVRIRAAQKVVGRRWVSLGRRRDDLSRRGSPEVAHVVAEEAQSKVYRIGGLQMVQKGRNRTRWGFIGEAQKVGPHHVAAAGETLDLVKQVG